MTRSQLEHAIRAACTVSDDNELWVFGSQAILALEKPIPIELLASIEVDVQPVNKPENSTQIDGNLGEGSRYHQTNGYCLEVHDLAVSKLAAFRVQDRDFVRTLLVHRLVDSSLLIERTMQTDMPSGLQHIVLKWVEETSRLI